MIETIRLKPKKPTRVGDYDLDAFAIEYDTVTDQFDFRLELGRGLGIYWALPAARHDRLRLLHVDGAAYTVDEPELCEDPFVADAELEWSGSLARVSDHTEVLRVSFVMALGPSSYRFEIETCSGAPDLARIEELTWRTSPPGR